MGLSPSSAFLVPAATPDTTNSQQIGATAPKAAGSWRAQTLSQALDEVLFPTILASILTPKSITLEVSGPAGELEIGTTHTRTLTATFNPGRIRNGDGTDGPELVGTGSFGFTFSGTGLPNTTQGNTLTLNNAAVVAGSNNWQVTRVHPEGTGTYTDNKGAAGTNLDGSRAAGSVTDSVSSPSITGVFPYYYIKSPIAFTREQFTAAIAAGNANNIAGATLTKVVASSAGTITIPYNLSSQFLGVAYPGAAKSNYFITTFDSGLLTAVFSTRTTASTSGQGNIWTNETFNYHLTPGPITNSNANIQIS